MSIQKGWALLSALLAIGLGGSIFLNVRLFHYAQHYYRELNKTQLDPLGLSEYAVESPNQTDSQKPRVVFFGDSRAASWKFPAHTEYEFINRGIGGQTSTQTVQRFEAHVRALQPDIVIIQVGINDLKAVALFPHRQDEIIANCKNNIQQLVEASRALEATVILTTIFPVGTVPLERQPFWSDAIGQAVEDVNHYIFTLASESILVLDTFPVLADSQGKMRSEYSQDELHLNDQGYVVLNEELVTLLDSMR
ncbi:MAG: GDSL-type esterase/lipase family protein [Cyanobacteria bacterium P01_F01_bin.86]